MLFCTMAVKGLMHLPLTLPFPPKVSYVVAAIQAGAVGTQACNEALTTIQSIVADLETMAMFCTAGALNPEGKIGSFAEHRYNIRSTVFVFVHTYTSQVQYSAICMYYVHTPVLKGAVYPYTVSVIKKLKYRTAPVQYL